MNMISGFSIKYKLIISFTLLLIFALAAFSSFIIPMEYNRSKTSLLEDARLQAGFITDNTLVPMLFDDKKAIHTVLSKIKSIPNFKAAAVYDTKKHLITSYQARGSMKTFAKKVNSLDNTALFLDDELVLNILIQNKEKSFGIISFYISTKIIASDLIDFSLLLIGVMLVVIIVSVIILYRLQNYLTMPIINLAKTAQEITLSENYTVRAQKFYDDEIGSLYEDFNAMMNIVEKRGRERLEAEAISRTYQAHLERLTNELEERVATRTIELEDSFSHLQNAQSQLVESEKMSALGNLVAGVAHEVNTPLGISITAASIFKNQIKIVQDMLDSNKLGKSALQDFLETITDADDILIKNLDRAALLVKNFKKISIDQSSEEIRDFELNTYLQEVVSTFKSELKHRPVELELKLDPTAITMHTYPGAISQIIVNLLQNALLHGFEPKQEGKIIVQTRSNTDHATIIFTDNGKGIDDDVAASIFEPFVTTKRNKGGTGLGLNIVYNLVQRQLGGKIYVDTDYYDGARFVVNIPYVVKEPTKS